MTSETRRFRIGVPHCQQCGSTDYEDVEFGPRENDGYTTCCNERVVGGGTNFFTGRPEECDPDECAHLED